MGFVKIWNVLSGLKKRLKDAKISINYNENKKIITMTPEEIFNKQVWEVLQDIKEEILVQKHVKEDRGIKFRVLNSAVKWAIPETRVRDILRELESNKAFKIRMSQSGARAGTGDVFYLIINQLKFDKSYADHEKRAHKLQAEIQQKDKKSIDSQTSNQPRLISRDQNSNYLYASKQIKMSKGTLYFVVFDILFLQGDQDGFLSYEDIEKHLVRRGFQESGGNEARNKRINNATTNKQQGLFQFAKVGVKPLKNKVPDGESLIRLIRGKGLQLNNPLLT